MCRPATSMSSPTRSTNRCRDRLLDHDDAASDSLDHLDADQTAAASTIQPITRRTAILAMAAALVFGVGLVASGRSASFVPVAWVALSARLIGLVAVVLPLLLQRRLRLTRAALPLVVIAGTGEVFGSMLGAWGSRESIPITAVMGSQFAAFAAVAAFLFFGERLGRLQTVGVVVIVAGITALAALQV